MIQLALPVIATYLGFMLMGVVDILCVGRVSAEAIGAVGVGTSMFSWIMVFGVGLLAGLDYLVSFAQGAGRPEDGYRAFVQSVIASTLLSVPLTGLLVFIAFHLSWIGVNPAVRPDAQGYLVILAFSLWPIILFNACRQYLTAMKVAFAPMIILLIANLLNAAINWLLVFGHLGAPAMGARGSAVATVVSRFAMLTAMAGYLWLWDRRHLNLSARFPFRIDRAVMKRFLSLGLPSATHMLFEVGVFALSTTLAARLTAEALAAHQIVLNIASLTFMVPLGVSAATAVLVGQSLGRGDRHEAKNNGWRGLALGTGFMCCSGVTLYLAHPMILALFTTDAEVRKLAGRIILIAALFQISDGIQVVAAGALRGLGDTRSPMIGNFCGHWLIGLPVGLLLCFRLGWGLPGLWVGLSLGLTTVAATLLLAWRYRSREKLQ